MAYPVDSGSSRCSVSRGLPGEVARTYTRWPGRARFPNSRRHFLTTRALLPSCSNDAGRTVSSALAEANAARRCLDCGRQTSITAGTAMHRSKLPLTAWFWAAHLMATHSNGDNPRKRAETLRRAPRRNKTATGMRHADAPATRCRRDGVAQRRLPSARGAPGAGRSRDHAGAQRRRHHMPRSVGSPAPPTDTAVCRQSRQWAYAGTTLSRPAWQWPSTAR